METRRIMLANYIDNAMEQAIYKIIQKEGVYWGEIPGLQGVWECGRAIRLSKAVGVNFEKR